MSRYNFRDDGPLCHRAGASSMYHRDVVYSRYASHGVEDSKGREVGSYLEVERWVMELAPADAAFGWRMDPGTYYVTRLQAARGKRSFGAIPRALFFTTQEEAVAHLEKSLKASIKRSRKQWVGGDQ